MITLGLVLALASAPHAPRDDVPLATCAVAVPRGDIPVGDVLLAASLAAVPRTLTQKAFVRRGGRLWTAPRPDGFVVVAQAHARFTEDACQAALDGVAPAVDAAALEQAQAGFLAHKRDPGLRHKADVARRVFGPGQSWAGLYADDVAAHRVSAETLGKRLSGRGPLAVFVEGPRDVSSTVRQGLAPPDPGPVTWLRPAPQPAPPETVQGVALLLPPEVAVDRDAFTLLARAYEAALGGVADIERHRGAAVLAVALDAPRPRAEVLTALAETERGLLSRSVTRPLFAAAAVPLDPVYVPGDQAVRAAAVALRGGDEAAPMRGAERLLWTRALLFAEALYWW